MNTIKCHLILVIFSLYSVTWSQTSILLKDVNVIPLTAETILMHQDVKMEGDLITAIRPTGGMLQADQVIEASGMFLIPGLSEMHAHIPLPADGNDDVVRETLFLYLANGITTIRGMLGDPYHLELKKKVDAHAFPSPRVYTSSPSLNGNTITTPEEARQKVRQYKQDGYDFLKIHPGIKREVFDEMAKTAREVGIDFSGHVPADVGIDHAIASGYASIDHLDGYVEGLAPEEIRDQGGFFGVLLADKADEQRIFSLVSATKAADIAVVPTQTLMTRWLSPKAPEIMVQEPEMVYIPASQRFNWRQNKQQMLDRLDYSPEVYDRFIQIRQKLLRTFHDQGVLILLGSDAPQVFNVPGFSIHHEMQSMVDAGLNNYHVLQSGTVNVARFFGASTRGTIEVGKVADLVLLNDNPLSDISNASRIEAVIYRGRLLPKSDIQSGLEKIAAKYDSEE